jgi:hypothetical protein
MSASAHSQGLAPALKIQCGNENQSNGVTTRVIPRGVKASAAEIKSGSGDINAVAEVINTASRGNVANVLEPGLPAGL